MKSQLLGKANWNYIYIEETNRDVVRKRGYKATLQALELCGRPVTSV